MTAAAAAATPATRRGLRTVNCATNGAARTRVLDWTATWT